MDCAAVASSEPLSFETSESLVPDRFDEIDPTFDELLVDSAEESQKSLSRIEELIHNIHPALGQAAGQHGGSPTPDFAEGEQGDIEHRNVHIRSVLTSCSNTLRCGASHGLDSDEPVSLRLTETLANMSRKQLWAVAFAEMGILETYLDAMAQSNVDLDNWSDPALRLIANCCARSHRTRMAVVGKAPFKTLISRLENQDQANMALLALYSISNDSTLAQRELQRDHKLTIKLLEGLEQRYFLPENMDQLCESLSWAAEEVDSSNLSLSQLFTVFELPRQCTLATENVHEIAILVTALLQQLYVQNLVLQGNLHCVMAFFLSMYSLDLDDVLSMPPMSMNNPRANQSDQDDLEETRVEFIKAFSTVAMACHDFSLIEKNTLTMVSWLRSNISQVQICACVFLGNLIYASKTTRQKLLRESELATSLSGCLRSTSRPEVLSSAFDLLQNTAVDNESREHLAQATVLDALAACWDSKGLDLKSRRSALYHTRQLIHGCPTNAGMFLGNGTLEYLSSALLPRLLNFFKQSQDEASITEVGRIIAEVWRTTCKRQDIFKFMDLPLEGLKARTSSEKSGDEKESLALIVWLMRTAAAKSEILEPLLTLIRSENRSLVTEGWLALALMVMSPEGALTVYSKLWEDENNFSLLQATMRGAEGFHKEPRANALYLASQLQKRLFDYPERQLLVNDLIREVGTS